MLNGLWAGMILIGIIFGAWNGKMPELTNAALDSSKDAVGELEEDRRLGRAFGPVRKRGVAGDEMCIFLILNISSLQLIPVNVIAYRSQYGSADPAGIIGGGILATMASTGAAVVYVLVMQRWGKRK